MAVEPSNAKSQRKKIVIVKVLTTLLSIKIQTCKKSISATKMPGGSSWKNRKNTHTHVLIKNLDKSKKLRNRTRNKKILGWS